MYIYLGGVWQQGDFFKQIMGYLKEPLLTLNKKLQIMEEPLLLQNLDCFLRTWDLSCLDEMRGALEPHYKSIRRNMGPTGVGGCVNFFYKFLVNQKVKPKTDDIGVILSLVTPDDLLRGLEEDLLGPQDFYLS